MLPRLGIGMLLSWVTICLGRDSSGLEPLPSICCPSRKPEALIRRAHAVPKSARRLMVLNIN
jgi:hypothetical protein